jgi:hypothetical protein
MAIFADFVVGRKYLISGWTLAIAHPQMGNLPDIGVARKT